MALTLNESTEWPTARELQRLGETCAGGTPSQIRNTLDRIAEAIYSSSADVRVYMKEDPDLADISARSCFVNGERYRLANVLIDMTSQDNCR
jgi:serine/threonine-protein kinase HipA